MRFLLFFLSCLFLLHAESSSGRELIVLTGGPALRYYEHGKGASHDMYWFNFVDASVIRLKELQPHLQPGEHLTWLVYRPGYARRSTEMERDLLAEITTKATTVGATLVWFDTTAELIQYLNQGQDRHTLPIGNFDYFGHSNKACFLFDYSNEIDGLSLNYLHINDLKRIHATIFAKDATCKSWGCHSGEEYSQKWKSRFDVPMTGAIGKTDFSHGGTPVLSDGEKGKWVQ